MSYRVAVVAEAERQVREIDAWWVEHRSAASDLFLDELARQFDLLASTPKIGRRFLKAEQPGVRRLLMSRTRHWIYYVLDPKRRVVYVLAVWSTHRGSDPNLPAPTLGD